MLYRNANTGTRGEGVWEIIGMIPEAEREADQRILAELPLDVVATQIGYRMWAWREIVDTRQFKVTVELGPRDDPKLFERIVELFENNLGLHAKVEEI